MTKNNNHEELMHNFLILSQRRRICRGRTTNACVSIIYVCVYTETEFVKLQMISFIIAGTHCTAMVIRK